MIKALLRLLVVPSVPSTCHGQNRSRARELGIEPGILTPGRWNAITDVEGVLVGQKTLVEGDSIRTGVTVVLPHPGNIFQEKVPAAVFVGNGFGKAIYYMAKDMPYVADGSCMIVVATDAPLSSRNLKRLAKRSFLAFGKWIRRGAGSRCFDTHCLLASSAKRAGHAIRRAPLAGWRSSRSVNSPVRCSDSSTAL